MQTEILKSLLTPAHYMCFTKTSSDLNCYLEMRIYWLTNYLRVRLESETEFLNHSFLVWHCERVFMSGLTPHSGFCCLTGLRSYDRKLEISRYQPCEQQSYGTTTETRKRLFINPVNTKLRSHHRKVERSRYQPCEHKTTEPQQKARSKLFISPVARSVLNT